jgi:hypothetical protein
MRIDQVAGSIVDQLLGRLIRRVLIAVAFALVALVALYHLTTAGTLALEVQYGAVNAQFIVGGIYAFVALICAIWWLVLGRSSGTSAPALPHEQRDMQIAMLVEAVMLGYALARKAPRTP